MLGQCEVYTVKLGDEDCRDPQEDRRAIQVERIPDRYYEADDTSGNTIVFKLLHQLWHYRRGCRTRARQDQLILEIADKLRQVLADQQADAAKYDQCEEDQCQVNDPDQLHQWQQGGEAEGCHGGTDHAEHPNGRVCHDIVHQLEHCVGGALQCCHDWGTLFARQGVQGHAEQYREEQDGKQLAFGQRLEEVVRHNVLQDQQSACGRFRFNARIAFGHAGDHCT
ncbi:hypothetical protein D3C75_667660 [compost metagenome]